MEITTPFNQWSLNSCTTSPNGLVWEMSKKELKHSTAGRSLANKTLKYKQSPCGFEGAMTTIRTAGVGHTITVKQRLPPPLPSLCEFKQETPPLGNKSITMINQFMQPHPKHDLTLHTRSKTWGGGDSQFTTLHYIMVNTSGTTWGHHGFGLWSELEPGSMLNRLNQNAFFPY